ncbi:hypothetical protein GW17_00042660 [Ensete ventricosum]|nr:hypothetical protein GW17_00042660 [Ensete ventricosum]
MRVRNSKLIEKVIMANGEARDLREALEGFFVKILNLRCQGDYLSGRTTSMLNAKLNGDSPELVLGVVWETHRMFGNSFA